MQPGFVAQWPNLCLYRSPSGVGRAADTAENVRVLIASANPSTFQFPFLPHVESELLRLSERLAQERRTIDVERLSNAGPATLRAALRRNRPHLLHFAGHAVRTPVGGDIILQGGRGEERVHALELAEWLREAGTHHVFLSACNTAGSGGGLAETLVVHGVSSAIGFHSQVRDDVQRAFVDEYYRELLAGRSVEAAVAWSRQARRLSPDWWMPVLVTQCPTWRMLPAGPLETSSERSTGNLPAFDDPFVGRKEELEALRCVILAERRRLVTVTGIGGLGKTRLAIEAASRMAHEFMDGVWIVPCDGLSSSEQLFAAIATSLKIDIGSASLDRALEAGLADRRSLIVLDCLESLVACGISEALEDLGHTCREVVFLATSRIALGGYAETEVALMPMSLPKEGAAQSDSIDLFIQAAGRVDRTFRIVPSELPVVSELCQLLEGIPLALQLAAARIPYLSLMELRDFVARESLDVLSSPGGSKQEAGLRRILEASLHQLPREDLEILHRLSIFEGGFFLRDAVRVLNVTEAQLVNSLVRLKAHSVVQSRRQDRTPRYRILDAVRACLDASIVDESLAALVREDRIRHALTFADYVRAMRGAAPEEREDRSAWLWSEIANVRTAAAYCFDSDLLEPGVAFAFGLALPLFEAGMWHDFDAVASAGHRLAQVTGDIPLELELLGLEGALAARRGRTADGLLLWERRRDLAAQTGDLASEADARLDIVGQIFSTGDYDEVERLALEALPSARGSGRADLVATIDIVRGRIAVERGDHEAARGFAIEAGQLAADAPETQAMLFVWTNIGQIRLACQDFAEADDAYRRTLATAYRRSRRFHIQGALLGLGRVYAGVGDGERAALCFMAAHKLVGRIPSKRRTEIERELEEIRIRLADTAGAAVFIEHESDAWSDVVERILSRPPLDRPIRGG